MRKPRAAISDGFYADEEKAVTVGVDQGEKELRTRGGGGGGAGAEIINAAGKGKTGNTLSSMMS